MLLFFAAAPAESQNLDTLFTTTTNFTNSKSGDATTDLQSYTQTLDLNWNRIVSPPLRYRFTLRATDSRSVLDLNTSGASCVTSCSERTWTSSTDVEPILDATLSSGAFSLHGGLRFRELWTDSNKQEASLLSERRWFARLFFAPEKLPALSFQVDGLTSRDDLSPRAVDKSEMRYQFTSDYTYEGFNASYQLSKRINEDFAAGQRRDETNHLGSLSYSRNSIGGWLDVLGGYTIQYSPIHETFSSGVKPDEVERHLTRGLKAAADLTPNDSSDVPLTDEPALLTGAALLPLDVNTSVGFEQILATDQIAELRLTLSPQAPFTLPSNLRQFLSFRVFFSNDPTLVAWTEIPGVTADFNPLDPDHPNDFILKFPSKAARFFKAYVSRNDFGALINVTRIVAADLEAVAAGTKKNRTSLMHSFNGSATLRPPTKLWTISALSYDVSLNSLTQQPDSIRTTTGTHTARLVSDPFTLLRSTLTYQHSFTSSNQADSKDTAANLYSAVFTSAPLPTLSTALTLSRNDTLGNDKLETRTDSGNFNVTAQLYRNLNADSTYQIARIEDFLNDRKTLTQSGNFRANAILTPRLNALAEYTIRWSDTEEPQKKTTELTHAISWSYIYTLSRFLNFNNRFDVLFGGDVSSFVQDYRVDWSPTPKVSIFGGYRRTQDSASGGKKTSSDSINANARWNLSSHLNLDGNFVVFKNSTGDRVYSINGRLQIRF